MQITQFHLLYFRSSGFCIIDGFFLSLCLSTLAGTVVDHRCYSKLFNTQICYIESAVKTDAVSLKPYPTQHNLSAQTNHLKAIIFNFIEIHFLSRTNVCSAHLCLRRWLQNVMNDGNSTNGKHINTAKAIINIGIYCELLWSFVYRSNIVGSFDRLLDAPDS